jgi:hypothetical protein
MMDNCHFCHGHENNQNFVTKTRTKASLVPNLYHDIKKPRTRTWHVWNKNPTKFYRKKETKIE